MLLLLLLQLLLLLLLLLSEEERSLVPNFEERSKGGLCVSCRHSVCCFPDIKQDEIHRANRPVSSVSFTQLISYEVEGENYDIMRGRFLSDSLPYKTNQSSKSHFTVAIDWINRCVKMH